MFFRRVAVEVVRLALHGSEAGLHPEEPVETLPVLGGGVREGYAVGRVVFGDVVELDGGAFEEVGWVGGGGVVG